jgi:hypothetical protein
MTARTIFYESRKRFLRVAVDLCIVLLALLLAAGCTGSHDGDKSDILGNVTPMVTPAPPTFPTTTQTSCPGQVNATPRIHINPVKDHQLNDVIEIAGTTNLDGGVVNIEIHDATIGKCSKGPARPDEPCWCCGGVRKTVPVITSTCGNNTWSGEVNTSMHNFYSSRFIVTVFIVDPDSGVSAEDGKLFNISHIPKPLGNGSFIRATLNP